MEVDARPSWALYVLKGRTRIHAAKRAVHGFHLYDFRTHCDWTGDHIPPNPRINAELRRRPCAMPARFMAAISCAIISASIVCAGCSVSIQAGHGNPDAERAYVAAIAQPMSALSAASSRANRACAGGSEPDPARCYSFTKEEISAARTLQRAMIRVATPPRFAEAQKDFLRGLNVFINGLVKRNAGLADHSSAEYSAGSLLIDRGIALQRAALTEYPASAHITP